MSPVSSLRKFEDADINKSPWLFELEVEFD